MNALKSTWNAGGANLEGGDSTSLDWNLDKDGNQVALKLMVGTRAQAEALVAADNDWKDITYTFS